jgi:hypothetical protein
MFAQLVKAKYALALRLLLARLLASAALLRRLRFLFISSHFFERFDGNDLCPLLLV